jgi:hypothetical protein
MRLTAPHPRFLTVEQVQFVYQAWYRYEHWHHGFPLIAAAAGVLS